MTDRVSLPSLIRPFLAQQGSTTGRCRLVAETDSRRWDRYSGGRVLTCIQSLIMSPLSRMVMKRVCYVRNQSDMQRFSDSDTGTQIIKGPLSLLCRQLPLLRRALLHGASNRRYILIAGSSNRLFFMPQYQQRRTHDWKRFLS